MPSNTIRRPNLKSKKMQQEPVVSFTVELQAKIRAEADDGDSSYKYETPPRIRSIILDRERVPLRKNGEEGANEKQAVPPEIENLINEILKYYHNHGILPAHFSMQLAYIVFENLGESPQQGTNDSTQLFVAYDVSHFRNKSEKVLSARYVKDSSPFKRPGSTTNILVDLDAIAEKISIKKNPERISWYKHAGFIRHDVRITGWQADSDGRIKSIRFDQTIQVFRYPMGELCKALPMPGFSEPHRWAPVHRPDHVFVIGECMAAGQPWRPNSRVWKNLEELTKVLENEPADTLDLLGATGKEAIAEAVHRGFARPIKQFLVVDASHHHEWETLEALLFDYHNMHGLTGSAVASTTKGTLFIDNTDWVPEKSRTYLMAAIRNRKYLLKRDQNFQEVSFPDTHWIIGHSQHLKSAEARPSVLKLESPFDGPENYVNAVVFFWIFNQLTAGFPGCLYDFFECPDHPDVKRAMDWVDISVPMKWKQHNKRREAQVIKEVRKRVANTPCYNFADAKALAFEIWFAIGSESQDDDDADET
ncbi:MAG: sigma 54-interacting transcriptional regulator [Candidatus Thiodiazotropha taylori]